MTRCTDGDDGLALVAVIGAAMIVMLFLAGVLQSSLQQQDAARRDQDGKIAYAAAQAGIDEYLSRLTADATYWQKGNDDSTNPAFTTGQTIQGTGAGYTYQLLTTAADILRDGQARLAVTGTSRGSAAATKVSRTLTATLTPRGSGNYAFLSDKEVIDPDVMLNHEHDDCATYWYSTRGTIADSDLSDSAADDNKCRNLPWTASDVVDGPLHSNDALEITGQPSFTDRATSNWPAIQGAAAGAKTWWGSKAAPLSGNAPVFASSVSLPSAGTTSLKTYVSPDVDGNLLTPPGDGCYYQGATRITFTGTTMSVFSPGTVNLATPSRCFDNSTPAKRNAVQTGLAIPPLIYVDAGTASCTFGAVGYPATAAGEHNENDGASEVAWDDPDNGPEKIWGWLPNYNCKRGTAYVSGTAAKAVTVGTQDDIVVTGNLTVDDLAGTSIIGLVARACVWVWHPIDDVGANITYTPVNTIQATVIAMQHSFLATYWTHGTTLGTLTVTGSVTTRYRGPMNSTNRTGAHGYSAVHYVLDRRLAFLKPPYLPAGDAVTWSVTGIQDR